MPQSAEFESKFIDHEFNIVHDLASRMRQLWFARQHHLRLEYQYARLQEYKYFKESTPQLYDDYVTNQRETTCTTINIIQDDIALMQNEMKDIRNSIRNEASNNLSDNMTRIILHDLDDLEYANDQV